MLTHSRVGVWCYCNVWLHRPHDGPDAPCRTLECEGGERDSDALLTQGTW